jgi:hypothetical protein
MAKQVLRQDKASSVATALSVASSLVDYLCSLLRAKSREAFHYYRLPIPVQSFSELRTYQYC